MNISQSIRWAKTLRERHSELVGLRNNNVGRERRLWGKEEKEIITEPTYDAKKIDALITKLAVELRKLDEAIKHTNEVTEVLDYEKNEDILGVIE